MGMYEGIADRIFKTRSPSCDNRPPPSKDQKGAMPRIDNRLKPTVGVNRVLLAHSGNSCAFQGCNNPILDRLGALLGEVCHIEAANPGGPRYNPSQTDEERRHISNLILLCRHHHRVTDDVEKFTVEVLRAIKHAHESKFRKRAALDSYASDLPEPHLVGVVKLPKNFGKLDLSAEEDINEYRASITPIFDALSSLPRQTLEVYSVAMRYAHQDERQLALYFDPEELKLRLPFLTEEELNAHIGVMDQYRVAHLPEWKLDYRGVPRQLRVYFRAQDRTDNTIWFMVEARRILIPINELENSYRNLDFGLLDT